MKNRRLTIIILVAIAVAAGIWAYVETSSTQQVALAHAWQLTPEDGYSGTQVTDPFVSWAPDSQSLLFGYSSKVSRKDRILKWNVGEKSLKLVVEGASPNYATDDEFLYMTREPVALYRRSLSTGKQSEVLASIKNDPFWDDVKGFLYDPVTKTIILRLVEFTRGYFAGTEAYDMNGKRLPEPNSYKGENVLDRGYSPRGEKCAVIVEAQQDRPASLQIAAKGKDRGKEVASGTITAVAWHRTGDMVAYGEKTNVALVRPSDGRTAVVARFSPPKNKEEERFVTRLSWSPNGDYLAVFVYVSGMTGDYPLIYVLDLSKFRWPE